MPSELTIEAQGLLAKYEIPVTHTQMVWSRNQTTYILREAVKRFTESGFNEDDLLIDLGGTVGYDAHLPERYKERLMVLYTEISEAIEAKTTGAVHKLVNEDLIVLADDIRAWPLTSNEKKAARISNPNDSGGTKLIDGKFRKEECGCGKMIPVNGAAQDSHGKGRFHREWAEKQEGGE